MKKQTGMQMAAILYNKWGYNEYKNYNPFPLVVELELRQQVQQQTGVQDIKIPGLIDKLKN